MSNVRKKIEKRLEEAAAELLVFPLKKQWLKKSPEIRTKRNLVKRSVAAFNAGSNRARAKNM